MRRLVEAPLKDFSKDLDNGTEFLMKSHITATEDEEQAGIITSVTLKFVVKRMSPSAFFITFRQWGFFHIAKFLWQNL